MLDFAALAAQMEKMLDEGRLRPDALPLALEAARRTCAACDARGDFNRVINVAMREGRVPDWWHPARLWSDNGALCEARNAPYIALPHLVAAADGSQIYPDAHQIADCYLLHISGVALRYDALRYDALRYDALRYDAPAKNENAEDENAKNENAQAARSDEAAGSDNTVLRATPHFFHGAGDDPWLARDIGTGDTENDAMHHGAFAANRELVDARRHVAELDELAALLDTAAPHTAAIGLCDGIFDLRVAASQPWRERATAENERALDALRQCGHPVGGYIAAPRATDVVTALRIALRESNHNGDEAHKNRTDSEPDGEPGDARTRAMDEALARLTDTRLFDALLQSGQRSATFLASRGVSQARGAGHQAGDGDTSRHATCFFYLKVDEGDVARLEFPRWVAEPEGWLDRLHALVLQQIEKGGGYPVALMEAHEHAVVRPGERELFYQLLEELMAARGFQPRRSAKALSKSRPLV